MKSQLGYRIEINKFSISIFFDERIDVIDLFCIMKPLIEHKTTPISKILLKVHIVKQNLIKINDISRYLEKRTYLELADFLYEKINNRRNLSTHFVVDVLEDPAEDKKYEIEVFSLVEFKKDFIFKVSERSAVMEEVIAEFKKKMNSGGADRG